MTQTDTPAYANASAEQNQEAPAQAGMRPRSQSLARTRETYTIQSGEGITGTERVVKATPRGLKRILTAERCGGDRWAVAYYGLAAKGESLRSLQPVSEEVRP